MRKVTGRKLLLATGVVGRSFCDAFTSNERLAGVDSHDTEGKAGGRAAWRISIS
jgi:hypothetical protein